MVWQKISLKDFLAIIDYNKFTYKNKIGEFNYIDIKDLVNNIKNNTISEISAKQSLNTLNKIKNAEIIEYKRRTPGQKELLNLFSNLLDTILSDKTLESGSQEEENENENDKTLMSSNADNENENENDNEKEDDDETMSQNKKTRNNKRFKWSFRWNNWQIKIIWRANKIFKKNRRSKRVSPL